jgi:hypothetical protein
LRRDGEALELPRIDRAGERVGRHGPHHAAQKSTRIGTRAPATISSNSASLATSSGASFGGSVA